MANVPISAFTVPANTVGIGATGYSLTGSANASLMDLAGTWNTSGTPTAIKLNITDTASNAASLLMDLQVGGTSRFQVARSGSTFLPVGTGIFFAGSLASNIGISGSGLASLGFICNGSTYAGLYNNSGQKHFTLSSDASVVWSSTTSYNGAPDTLLTRRGAANLRLGAADAAAPVAQTLSVQGRTGTDAAATAYPFTIQGAQGTGTGAGGSLVFRVAPAGSSGSAQNALATALTIDSASALLTSTGGIRPTASGADTGFLFGGSSTASFAVISNNGINIRSTGFLSWSSVVGPNTNAQGDVALFRDAANTLALRNGTAAQTFNVYNTFTDASNYERGYFRYVSNQLEIGHDAAGTGTAARSVLIRSQGNLVLRGSVRFANTGGTENWRIDTNLFPSTTNAVDLGTSSARVRSAFFGTSTVNAGYHEMAEMTAPAAPAADGVRIYAVDNGSGKTQLMALFATGAAQQIAIEP